MKCLELVFQRVNKSLGLWILVLAPFYAAPAGAQSYSITNLGVLPGGTYSFSTGLNAKGEATGYGDASQGSVRAWRYSHGALIDLGTLGTSYSLTYAYDINDHGDVTGYSFTAEGDARAFLYHDGKMQDIGTLGGTESGGYAINNAGEITGVSDILYDTGAAAFTYREGTMRSLGGLGGTDGNGLGAIAHVVAVTHAVKIDNPLPTNNPPPPQPTMVVNLRIDSDGALSRNGSGLSSDLRVRPG